MGFNEYFYRHLVTRLSCMRRKNYGLFALFRFFCSTLCCVPRVMRIDGWAGPSTFAFSDSFSFSSFSFSLLLLRHPFDRYLIL